MTNLTILDAKYLGDYVLLCTFSSGVTKRVDMSPLLSYPAYEELKDQEQFRQFGLDETIFWANGADIAPEWVYANGVPVSGAPLPSF